MLFTMMSAAGEDVGVLSLILAVLSFPIVAFMVWAVAKRPPDMSSMRVLLPYAWISGFSAWRMTPSAESRQA